MEDKEKKEKKIEEMAKDMCGNPDTRKKDLCSYCVGWSDCLASAEALYNADYRKQSDIVREFVEKVKKIIHGFENISQDTDDRICEQIDECAEEYGVKREDL